MNDLYQYPDDSTQNKASYTYHVISIAIDKLQLPDILFDKTEYSYQNASELLPIVVYEDHGTFRIIDGCKRFLSMSKNNDLKCVCIVITSLCDSKTASLLRIELNQNRTLSFSEKYLFLNWLKDNLSENEYNQRVQSLQITSKERFELEKILSSPDYIIAYIKNGFIDLNIVPELLTLDKCDQDVLLQFFSQLQFSRSTQREIIEWVPEIAYRNKISVSSVLHSCDIEELLGHPTMNQPQIIQKIREILYKERFPTLSKAKSEWTELSRKANPDSSHVQFIANEAFEKNKLEIKITISNTDEILTILEKLKNLTPELWEKLIYPA